jgi:hypothetical protein
MTNPKPAAVAPHSEPQPPSAMSDEMLALTAEDAGFGVSTDPADLILPLITVLQNNSPICDMRSADYIDGAVAGAFWFRGDRIEIRDGVIGFDCVPVKMVPGWLEWGPSRGDGLRGRHLKQPEDVETRISQEDGRSKQQLVRRGTGNVLQEVREFFVMVDGKPYVLSFHGSGHTVARKWQTYFNQFRHPKTGGIMPSYSRRYHLVTVTQNNKLGRWFNVKFEDRGDVTMPEYLAARELHAIVKRGAFRIDMSEAAALTSDAT